MSDHHETERTWAPSPDAELPDLASLPKVVSVGLPRSVEVHTTYVDTSDLALARADVALARQTGGDAEGWLLSVPAGHGHDDVRRPLGTGSKAPAPLARSVLGWTRGAELGPVASVTTTRTVYDLLDAEGTVLAALTDSRVQAGPVELDSPPTEWREWDVALLGGRPKLLRAAARLFGDADVELAEVRHPLEVLADRLPVRPAPATPKPGKPASRVLHRRFAQQVALLAEHDSGVRRGSREDVHRLRLTLRRLRGVLATYRPLLDRDVTDPIRDDLQWVARALGDARDAHVVHGRLRRLLDEEPRGCVVGPVRRRLGATYRVRGRDAMRSADDVLASERYLALRDSLDWLVDRPPLGPEAGLRADEVLRPRVRHEWKRVQKAYDDLADALDPDAARHDLRRAAKRLRYAADVLVPVWGRDAKRVARAAKRVTATLGERQDTVISRVDLLEISREAGAAGENAFTYGRLHAREEARVAVVEQEFEDAWAFLAGLMRTKKVRRWLR